MMQAIFSSLSFGTYVNLEALPFFFSTIISRIESFKISSWILCFRTKFQKLDRFLIWRRITQSISRLISNEIKNIENVKTFYTFKTKSLNFKSSRLLQIFIFQANVNRRNKILHLKLVLFFEKKRQICVHGCRTEVGIPPTEKRVYFWVGPKFRKIPLGNL